MTTPRPPRILRSILALPAVALLLINPFAAGTSATDRPAADVEVPKTALQRFDVSLNQARDLVHNASIKLRNGIRQGVTREQQKPIGEHGRVEPELNPQAPGVQCCAGNLERLSVLYRDLVKELGEVKSCYERSNVERSLLDSIQLAEEDLQSLARATERFSTAPDMAMADGSVAAMQRAWLLLKKSRDGLVECR